MKTQIREQPDNLSVVSTAELLKYINLEDLLPNPYQPETRREIDQEKVGTGNACCTFIITPHIVDGACLTRKVKGGKLDNASDNASVSKDPLADLVIHTATEAHGRHLMKLNDYEVRGYTLMECVLALGKAMEWDKYDLLATLRAMPESDNKNLLVSILEGENEGA